MTNNLDWLSHDIHSEKLTQIQQLMPELFKEGKLDPQALKNFFWDNHDKEERYGLWWAGKSGVFKVIKDRTSKTLHPEQDKSVDWDSTQNLFIEGDNLDVLKILQKSYYNKIKMIYIDPPYNTWSDAFVYPDDYSMSTDQYNELAGDLDDDGNLRKDDNLRKNSKDSGRYHSNWLSMMYSRLYLARNLLTDDGVIFVSIDDNEVHNLRLLLNEIFGEENFIAQIIVEWTPKNDPHIVSTAHEYCLVYTKDFESAKSYDWWITSEEFSKTFGFYETNKDKENFLTLLGEFYMENGFNSLNIANYNKVDEYWLYRIWPIDDPQSKWPKDQRINPKTWNFCTTPSRGWSCNIQTRQDWISKNLIRFPDNDNQLPAKKTYLTKDRKDLLRSYFKVQTRKDTQFLNTLFGFKKVFDNPKPRVLIKTFIESATSNNDIILDFFSWSWTTAHAVMDLNTSDGGNRKYIMVQYPEDTEEWSEAYKAWYKTIPEIARERIRRAGQKILEDNKDMLAGREIPLDIGFKSFVVGSSNFKQRRADKIDDQTLFGSLEDHLTLIKSHSTPLSMLYELILKHGVSLTEHITTQTFAWKEYFDLWNGSLIVCLEKELTQELIDHLLTLGARLILLDEWFKGNDALLKNTHLQCQHNGITLHTL